MGVLGCDIVCYVGFYYIDGARWIGVGGGGLWPVRVVG